MCFDKNVHVQFSTYLEEEIKGSLVSRSSTRSPSRSVSSSSETALYFFHATSISPED